MSKNDNTSKVRVRAHLKAGSPSHYLNQSIRVLEVKTKIKAGFFGNTDPSHSYGWDPVGQYETP